MAALQTIAGLPSSRQPVDRAAILLIEDDFSIRRTIAQVLGDEGYKVDCAADGREALSILTDRGVRPGLIILDLWMPHMDGLQFLHLQRSLAGLSDVPVLVITASRFLPRELEELGLNHVLRKPLDLEQMLGATRLLLRRPDSGVLSPPSGRA